MSAPKKVKLPPRKKNKNNGFHWGTLFTGLIAGVLITWLAMSNTINFKALLNSAGKSPAGEPPVDNSNDIVDNLPIEFYKLLPSREEQIPAHIISQRVRENMSGTQMDSASRYRLQAGSFQKVEDADRRRASILFLGLDTHIERVTHGGKTWHRVMLGPFDTLKQLEVSRRRMHANKIETIVLKLKDSG